MPTLLHLDASPLESSVSRELGREFVATWKAAHPDGRVVYRDLAVHTPAAIDQAWVTAVFTPAEAQTPEQKALLVPSDELIDELFAADEVAIGIPMHNFTISAALKLWIDQIVRKGRTFTYGADGPKGLLTGKKATLLVASGGVYSPGTPAAAMDFIEPYMKTILGFLGITQVQTFTVGGVSQLRTGAIDRATLLQPALERVRTSAA